jgi:8-oxo-dGTP pyrophosphatase MutT (NUDIX family)
MSKDKPEWITHSSKIVHKNNWFKVKKDDVTRPTGKKSEYYVVMSEPAVFIIPQDDVGNIYLIGQTRYTIGEYSMEVPAGNSEGGDVLEAAKRDLQEETGFSAENWEKLGEFYPANGLLNEKAHVYLATGLEQTGKNEQAEEGIDELYKFSLKDLLEKINNGEIQDGQTLSSLMLLLNKKGLIKDQDKI